MSIPCLKIPTKGFRKVGDTFPKIKFVLGGDWSEDLSTLHRVRCQIYNGNSPFINLDSNALGGITIIDSNTFEIDEIPCNVTGDYPVGTFRGDLQIERYTAFGQEPVEVKTYFNIEYTTIKEYTVKPQTF
ncbi:MAG: hypothetical protein HRU26_05685 [Psychroserpens sp.]|nr:hypothetical protein [Psychroserpens sp.]